MAVEVLEAMPVHKSQVHRRLVGIAAGGHRGIHHFIDARTAFHRQANQHFGEFARIADVIRRETAEFGFGQQHHENVLANDHAGGGVIGKLRIEGKAKTGEERDRLLQVAYWQIDKDLLVHEVSGKCCAPQRTSLGNC
ncbi:hypothetical protein D3C72_1051720 [compost metagenome]